MALAGVVMTALARPTGLARFSMSPWQPARASVETETPCVSNRNGSSGRRATRRSGTNQVRRPPQAIGPATAGAFDLRRFRARSLLARTDIAPAYSNARAWLRAAERSA